MTLREVISNLSNIPDYGVLCVKKPWAPESECVVVNYDEDDDESVPAHVTSAGFEYFLPIFVANEVLEGREWTLDEKLSLLIYYAEYDAFPAWTESIGSD